MKTMWWTKTTYEQPIKMSRAIYIDLNLKLEKEVQLRTKLCNLKTANVNLYIAYFQQRLHLEYIRCFRALIFHHDIHVWGWLPTKKKAIKTWFKWGRWSNSFIIYSQHDLVDYLFHKWRQICSNFHYKCDCITLKMWFFCVPISFLFIVLLMNQAGTFLFWFILHLSLDVSLYIL